MKLDPQTIEWIERAIDAAPYGKVMLITQDGRVMKIEIESKKEIRAVDKNP